MHKLCISYLILVTGLSWAIYTGIETSVDDVTGLLSKRNEELHWGRQTWIAVMALSQLLKRTETATEWTGRVDIQVAIKQMDIELLLIMLKSAQMTEHDLHNSGFINYIFTLNSLCRDPKDFYGYNLLDDLWSISDPSHFAYAYKALAVCSANGTVTKQHLKQLVDMLVTLGSEAYGPDTAAMTLMAAVCFAENYREFSQLKHLYGKRLEQLLRFQDANGSINRNIISTSLAAQVFSSIPGYEANAELAKQWLKTGAIQVSCFQELMCTAETILAFSGRGRLDVNIRSCATDAVVPGYPERPNTTVTYVVWYDPAGEEERQIQLSVPANTTLFEVMQRAAEMDSSFEFHFEDDAWGRVITSIGNRSQSPENSIYWMLYVDVPHMPTSTGNPEKHYARYKAKTGVDSIVPKHGAYILFWLQHVPV